ncbi:MAG TPA: hypothetical protein PKJ94_06365 [Ferruginibacter sp.]|nr:hypothetical protein [Ferruginibacter sp.]
MQNLMQQQPALFESLFKRNLEDPSVKNFLEEITAVHPYFSPAQFYLLQQTTESTVAFDRQATKTNIFFNNPLWLNFQLRQAKPGMPVEEKTYSVPAEEPLTEELPVIEHIAGPEEDKEVMNEAVQVEEFVPEVQPEFIKEEQPVIEHSAEPEEDKAKEDALVEEFEPAKEERVVTGQVLEPEVQTEPEIIQEELHVIEAVNEPGPGEEPELEPMKIELKLPEEKNIKEDELLFEPMHLVDYFASQGIKLNEEAPATDKLGKQLKSFTEWLKTMKKVHAAPAEEGEQPDKTVEAMAERSNKENEVITEAMAEVFARQGKTAKATEVYQKLSLLNPAKSAYFAAKIDNLKGA